MPPLKPIEWLALQRLFFLKPKRGLEEILLSKLSMEKLPLEQAKKDLEQLEKLNLELIPWDSERFPKILKEIYDPPLVLLAKGRWPKWETRTWVAVVGARKATEFGKKKTEEIVQGLVEKQIGIVSGLAYGIDTCAHRAAVEAGGVTWGVLGSGPDRVYPTRHRSLAEVMTKQGGYLSEFPLGAKPYPFYFPQRNRIISGLSRAVIIIEATLQSGSLITARFALEQGREVFVVTPPEENVAYEGNKMLLDDGATPYESADQIWETIQLQTGPFHAHTQESWCQDTRYLGFKKEGGHPASSVLPFLKQPQSLEALVQKTQKSPQQIVALLTLLEAQGLVKKIPGSLWQSL